MGYLDAKLSLQEAVRRTQTRSRQFAKRQMTWFRHVPGCVPVAPELTFAAWGLKMEN
jgi:tRNA dimethylallyltransferase